MLCKPAQNLKIMLTHSSRLICFTPRTNNQLASTNDPRNGIDLSYWLPWARTLLVTSTNFNVGLRISEDERLSLLNRLEAELASE